MSVAPWAAALVCGAAAAVVAAADGALLATDPPPNAGEGGARAPSRIADRERAHRALVFARTLLLLGAGVAFGEAARGAGERASVWRILLAGVLPALLLVGLIEGGARALGHALGARALLPLLPVVRALELLLAPPLALLRWADATLQRLVPPPTADEEERETSAERFRQVVAAEAGDFSGEEALLAGVFSLGDTEVREVMVPRVDIVGIDRATPWADVLARVRSSEHARFPVYEETLDEIVGILYAKDLLAGAVLDREPDGGWTRLMRPPSFIPTSKTIDAQLRDFKASRTHIAIVTDEFGGTAGLVTIEDVLEEIVGEIKDEYDVEEPEIEIEEGRRFWVAGRVAVDALRDLIGHDFALDLDEVATVGGVVFTLFGRVPRSGEQLVRDGFRIIVERVRRRRIERVYFERLETADTGAEAP